MIDVNAYLTKLDQSLCMEDAQRAKIDRSIDFIKQKVWGIFQDRLAEVRVFGSYPKNTFITKDAEADVDILVVFKSKDFQPQTYLNQIKAFAETHYSRSTIYPDHPTIAIELEHIKFEIVPAIYQSVEKVMIPAPRTAELRWIGSYPTIAQNKLEKKDAANKGFIRPVIRIIKYWNYLQGHPFGSFEIERQVIDKGYNCSTLKAYFYEALTTLSDITSTEPQKKFLSEIKERLRRLRVMENHNLPEYIETELSSVLPIT